MKRTKENSFPALQTCNYVFSGKICRHFRFLSIYFSVYFRFLSICFCASSICFCASSIHFCASSICFCASSIHFCASSIHFCASSIHFCAFPFELFLCKFELYLCEFDLFVCSVRFIFVRVRIIFVRFNLFLCGSILFRELQHIATVLYINIMNITNFDRNGTPYSTLTPKIGCKTRIIALMICIALAVSM